MKFSLSWLNTHLDHTASLDDVLLALTKIGIEVEGVEDQGKALKNFVIAKVLETAQHPNADRLRVCVVDNGTEKVSLVCGAPNARAGMTTVFAPIGTYVPGLDVTLKKAQIRGVDSNGMLCSGKELCFSQESDGIMDLPDGKPGTPIVDHFGLNDPVIDVSVTPNRPDWLGVRGIARDLAASGFGTLKPDNRGASIKAKGDSGLKFTFDFGDVNPAPCSFFAGRLIKNVKNGQSPEWLQKRLTSIGLRPVSALVDITNFLTFDLCRPLHVFDNDKLKGQLTLRLSKGGEELAALNNKTYTLDDGMTVICDDSGVLSLAGVIGGTSSSCDESTTTVLLEGASFDPTRTARTGRMTGIISDARYRFERGVDPDSVLSGIDIATALILEVCGGEPTEVVSTGSSYKPSAAITLPVAKIAHLTGVDVPAEKAVKSLEALGCKVRCHAELDSASGEIPKQVRDDKMEVTPPSWRGDMHGAADVIEEILRLYGYDNIPETSLPKLVPDQPLSTSLLRRGLTRQFLINRGLDECVSYSFLSLDKAKMFGGGQDELCLENPISVELSTMRPSLLPNLLDAASRNASRGQQDVCLFEIGATYHTDTPEGQFYNAAAIRMGKNGVKHWSGSPRVWDVYDAKADLTELLGQFGFKSEQLQLRLEAPSWYHPGRSGTFYFAGKHILGVFGELHPSLHKSFDIDQPVVMSEIYLDTLPELPARKREALVLSPYQAVTRDYAFVVDQKVQAGDVLRTVKGIDKVLVQNVEIFDVYQGDKLEAGKKSLAISVKLQAADRTLTDAEIDAISQKIVASVKEKAGGVLRT